MISPDAQRMRKMCRCGTNKSAHLFGFRLKIALKTVVSASLRPSSGQDFVQKRPQGTGVPDAHCLVE